MIFSNLNEKRKQIFEDIKNFCCGKTISTYIFCFAIFVVVLAGIYLRLKLYSLNLSLWNDEASLALNVSMQSYYRLFATLKLGQASPPLFLICSKFLLDISGQSTNIVTRDLVLRILPMLCAVFSVPFFAFVVHKIFKHRYITLFAVTILAFNVSAVNYAQEFKQYGVELFVTIFLVYLFWKFKYSDSSLKTLFKYSVLFSITPWFAYSAVFLIPVGYSLILYDFFKNKDYDKKKIFSFAFPTAVSFFFFLLHYFRISVSVYPSMAKYWENVLPTFFDFNNFNTMFSERTYLLLPYFNEKALMFILAAALMIFVWKNYKNPKILFLILTPLLLLITASFLHRYPYALRLVIFTVSIYAIILSHFGALLKRNTACDIIVSALSILITAYYLSLPIKTYNLNHYNFGKEYVLIMKSQKAQMKNILGFTRVGLWYLLPYLGKGDENVTAYNFPKEEWPDRIKALLEKMPDDEELWLYAPHTYPFLEYDLIVEAKKYIETNPRFEILKTWINEEDNGFLIKFRKTSLK